MKAFEYELENIQNLLFEMFELVKDQIHLTKEALLTNDHDLSSEIMRKETRVNSFELTIDREIEDFFALQAPVASDLRFAMAALKISNQLERVGDHAARIASYVFDDKMRINKELVELLQIPTLFDEIDDMLINVTDALDSGDMQLAKRVFKQDKTLDKVNKKLPNLLEGYNKKHKEDISNLILLSRMIGKLERCGDMAKNMAEEIMFYHESKVIKHRKKNKKIARKLEKDSDESSK